MSEWLDGSGSWSIASTQVLARSLNSRLAMGENRTSQIVYHLHEILGQGLASVVYRATKADAGGLLAETVALKLLNSKSEVQVWRDEFESMRRIHSPFAVRALGFDWVEGRPALIMEYIEGLTLETVLAAGPIPQAAARSIIDQLEAGLLDLHRAGLCHGDLSLTNVMVDLGGQLKLLDFGRGNSAEGRRRATLEFAAPETCLGAPATPDSDWYSFARIKQLLVPQLTAQDGIESGSESQRQLAETVARIWRTRLTAARTERCESVPRKQALKVRRAGALFLTLSLVALIAGDQSAGDSAQSWGATIAVRSQQWAEIWINRRSLGFAPLDAQGIPAGRVELSWRTARGLGSRTLTVSPGDHILLTDKELNFPPSEGATCESHRCNHSGSRPGPNGVSADL